MSTQIGKNNDPLELLAIIALTALFVMFMLVMSGVIR